MDVRRRTRGAHACQQPAFKGEGAFLPSRRVRIVRQIIAVSVKEFKVLWHDREALALLFVMPVFFIFVMSLALEGVFETGTAARPLKVLIANEDRGPEAQKVVDALEQVAGIETIRVLAGAALTRRRVEALIAEGAAGLALHFPAGFSETIKTSPAADGHAKAAFTLIVDPALNDHLVSSLKGSLLGIVERQALLQRLPSLIAERVMVAGGSNQIGTAATREAVQSTIEDLLTGLNPVVPGQASTLLTIVPLREDGSLKRPTSSQQNVPGYTIFGVFFIVLTLASSFVRERNEGTFQRLLSAPLPKAALLAGKLLPYYLVNLIQITLMFAVGVLFFGLILGDVAALLLVSLALAAAANGLGLLVAAVGKPEAQVNALAVLLSIVLSALGGMMVPVFVMPDFMQTIARFTPHAWALAGYHDVIIRGLGIGGVLGEIAVLAGFAGLFSLVALWRFRFD